MRSSVSKAFLPILLALIMVPAAAPRAEDDPCVGGFTAVFKKKGTASDRFIALRTAATTTVLLAVTGSYEEEIKDLYQEHIKRPFRKYMRRGRIIGQAGGVAAYNSRIDAIQQEAAKMREPGFAQAGAEEQWKAIAGSEAAIREKFAFFREHGAIFPDEAKKVRAQLDASSERLVLLALAFSQSRERADTRPASRALADRAESELASALARWKVYEALLPPAEEESARNAEVNERFRSMEEALSGSLDPNVYRKALLGQLGEALAFLRRYTELKPT